MRSLLFLMIGSCGTSQSVPVGRIGRGSHMGPVVAIERDLPQHKPGSITCYSGGTQIYKGNYDVSDPENFYFEGLWHFTDLATKELVQINADCIDISEQ